MKEPTIIRRTPESLCSVTNIVPLNNVDHADLRVAQGYGAPFGDAINLTRVFPPEFEALQREYVILFLPDPEGGMQAVVLLGLDRDENLFLEGEAWDARYVPAMQRRGPFSIGVQAGDLPGERRDPRINVDLDHPRIVREGGEAVFRRHGGNSEYLKGASKALATLYEGLEQTAPMFAAFAQAGLIEPVAIDITIGEGKRYDLDRFHAISRDRLAALAGPELEHLHHQGWLTMAIHVASSIANIESLIARKTRRGGAL